jgi:hypothetical protein
VKLQAAMITLSSHGVSHKLQRQAALHGVPSDTNDSTRVAWLAQSPTVSTQLHDSRPPITVQGWSLL